MRDHPIAVATRNAIAAKLGPGLVMGRPLAIDVDRVAAALDAGAEAARQAAIEAGHEDLTLAETRVRLDEAKAVLAAREAQVTTLTAERDAAHVELAQLRPAPKGAGVGAAESPAE